MLQQLVVFLDLVSRQNQLKSVGLLLGVLLHELVRLNHAVAVKLILHNLLFNDLLLEFKQIDAVNEVFARYEVALAMLAGAFDSHRASLLVFNDFIKAK